MEKQEFLDKLQLSLNGRLAPETVKDTVRYYEDYINTEIRMDRSEEEVMTSLGDPRLIARTIIETNGGQPTGGYTASDGGENQNHGENSVVPKNFFSIPGWAWGVIGLVFVFMILSFAFKLISLLWPVIAVAALVLFLIKLFKDWLN